MELKGSGLLSFQILSAFAVPTAVVGIHGAEYAAAGQGFTVVTDRSRGLWCFGDGVLGQLGIGKQELTPVPTRVATLQGME